MVVTAGTKIMSRPARVDVNGPVRTRWPRSGPRAVVGFGANMICSRRFPDHCRALISPLWE